MHYEVERTVVSDCDPGSNDASYDPGACVVLRWVRQRRKTRAPRAYLSGRSANCARSACPRRARSGRADENRCGGSTLSLPPLPTLPQKTTPTVKRGEDKCFDKRFAKYFPCDKVIYMTGSPRLLINGTGSRAEWLVASPPQFSWQ